LSLLEVLVALSIFLFTMIAIGRLASMGGDRAMDVQQQARATQLCQSKLAEVVAGAVQLTQQSNVPFDEDPQWDWSLDCQQNSVAGLWTVSVKVGKNRADGSRVESTITQMVLDPSLRGGISAPSTTSSSSGSSNTTPTSTGGT
jgi:type II secretory pathway pseudopilin PulG